MRTTHRHAPFVLDNGVTMKTSDGRLEVTRHDNVLDIQLIAEVIVDEQTITEIARDVKMLTRAVEKPVVVLDFSHVTHLSSCMLGELMVMRRRAKRHDGDMAITHIQPMLMEIFEITQFNRRLHIFDTFEQAMLPEHLGGQVVPNQG